MSLPIVIKSGVGSGFEAQVTSDNALKVTQVPILLSSVSDELLTRRKALVQQFADPSGNTSMIVNASAGAITFSAGTSATVAPGGSVYYRCLFIKKVRIYIRATNIGLGQATNLRNFGPFAGGLANGIQLRVIQGNITTPIFTENVTVLSQFLQYLTGYYSFLSVTNSPTTDLTIVDIDFHDPVVIPPGSGDRIEIILNDNFTGTGWAEFKASVQGSYELVL